MYTKNLVSNVGESPHCRDTLFLSRRVNATKAQQGAAAVSCLPGRQGRHRILPMAGCLGIHGNAVAAAAAAAAQPAVTLGIEGAGSAGTAGTAGCTGAATMMHDIFHISFQSGY